MKKGLTQAQLANIGKHQQSLQRVEAGKNDARMEFLLDLAAGLGIKVLSFYIVFKKGLMFQIHNLESQ